MSSIPQALLRTARAAALSLAATAGPVQFVERFDD
jgi:hypothetical protein